MGIAKVTTNFQVTIPKDVRTMHDIKIGDTLIFSLEGDKIELITMKKDIINQVFGIWKDMKEDSAEYVKKLREAWSDREKKIFY